MRGLGVDYEGFGVYHYSLGRGVDEELMEGHWSGFRKLRVD